MRREQQRSTGRFVASTRLNSDETILHQIDASHGIPGADLIQQFDERHGIHIHAVHRNRNSLNEVDADLFLFVWSVLWRARNLPGRREWSISRILQLPAFMADVPQITVAAVNLLPA